MLSSVGGTSSQPVSQRIWMQTITFNFHYIAGIYHFTFAYFNFNTDCLLSVKLHLGSIHSAEFTPGLSALHKASKQAHRLCTLPNNIVH